MHQSLLMSRQEAARYPGMSLSHFQRHVQAQMPCVQSGQLRLYRRRELEHWVDRETDRKEGRRQLKGLSLEDAHSRFVADCKSGIALNKRGRRYKAKAIIDLDSSLKRLPSEIRLALIDDLGRGEIQGAVDEFRREGLSSSRIASIVNAVRSLYRWAICREMAFANPAERIQLPACNSKERNRVATPVSRAPDRPAGARGRPALRARCLRHSPLAGDTRTLLAAGRPRSKAPPAGR